MAININPGTPLRHVATITSTGSWTAPVGTTLAFVSIHGATGGGGSGNNRPQRYGQVTSGSAGGVGTISAAYVQVTPGSAHTITIGAGGAGGGSANPDVASAGGSTGGTTVFDGAFSVTSSGGAGGIPMTRYTFGTTGSASGTGSGTTSLTTVNPGASTLIRTGTITSQTTGGSSGGGGGGAGRYTSSAGGTGAAGFVHIYI